MDRPLLFSRPRSGIVKFSEQAVAALFAHRQLDGRAPESGGILLGRLISGSSNVVVDLASPPTKHDQRSRFRFLRALLPAQQLVDETWAGTSGTRVYLGEWHTHPEDHPSPSVQDTTNWKDVLERTQSEIDFLLFVIVGHRSVAVWEGERATARLAALGAACK